MPYTTFFPCSICGKRVLARGWCRNHYMAWKRHGTPTPHVATLEERFWAFVDKEGLCPSHRPELGPCWVWIGGNIRGYGHFAIEGKTVKAHRYSWELYFGEIPEDLCVLHHCDNPSCVNPKHLFLGTHAVNASDRNQKGRHCKGEESHLSKLTEEDVLAIRCRYVYGSSTNGSTALALEFGVSYPTILRIIKGRCWKHL